METGELVETMRRSGAPPALLGLLAAYRKAEARQPRQVAKLATQLAKIQMSVEADMAAQNPESLFAEEMRRPLAEWLRLQHDSLEATRAEQKQVFGVRLAARLKESEIDLKGAYPRMQASLFVLTLDFVAGECILWYGPEQERLAKLATDPDKVAAAIVKARGNLGSKLEPASFAAKLAEAAALTQCSEGRKPKRLPALLPSLAFLQQSDAWRQNPLRSRFTDYSRADFSFDLYRCQSALGGIRLATAIQSETQRRSDFLWIPSNLSGSGGYFSKITFPGDK